VGGGFVFKFVHFIVEKNIKIQIKSTKKFIKKQLKIYNIEKSVQKFILVKKLLLCGDVESNPGPATYQQHRMCNNKFYLTAVKLGQKNCLQQYLGMNSGQFYYWKKKNLSCPKTSLLPKNKLSKMQKIKCRKSAFSES